MKLTEENIELLKSWGYSPKDIKQIKQAITKTDYTYWSYFAEKKISANKAVELLGITDFLSGLSRSAFHFTASRNINGNTTCGVSFDSSRLFKEA